MQGSINYQGQKFVVLEHLTGRDKGFRFYTSTSEEPDHDYTTSIDDDDQPIVAYKIVWFTDSGDEAIRKIEEEHSLEEILKHHDDKILEDVSNSLRRSLMIDFFDDDKSITPDKSARRLIRDVPVAECHWLSRDYKKGEIVFEYYDCTYGCCSDTGTPCTEVNQTTPFFELPNDSFDTM